MWQCPSHYTDHVMWQCSSHYTDHVMWQCPSHYTDHVMWQCFHVMSLSFDLSWSCYWNLLPWSCSMTIPVCHSCCHGLIMLLFLCHLCLLHGHVKRHDDVLKLISHAVLVCCHGQVTRLTCCVVHIIVMMVSCVTNLLLTSLSWWYRVWLTCYVVHIIVMMVSCVTNLLCCSHHCHDGIMCD